MLARRRFAVTTSTAPVVFWQMPPIWGLPNASPFCMKLEVFLRMAKIPYVAKSIEGPPKSQSGKVPYIERADGSLLWDSSRILETLSQEHGVDLDAGLTEQERAQGLLIKRLFEEELYFIALYTRWVDEQGWAITRPAYFDGMPWFVRTVIVPFVRRQIVGAARGQGVGRLPEGYREKKGIEDVRALSTVLGDKPYFLGRPSTLDCTAYAFLANAIEAPFHDPVVQELRKQANLVAYCERMKQTYFADWNPPS
jgi:glutathione S-transferase